MWKESNYFGTFEEIFLSYFTSFPSLFHTNSTRHGTSVESVFEQVFQTKTTMVSILSSIHFGLKASFFFMLHAIDFLIKNV